jgi:hypothetical protein
MFASILRFARRVAMPSPVVTMEKCVHTLPASPVRGISKWEPLY